MNGFPHTDYDIPTDLFFFLIFIYLFDYNRSSLWMQLL